MGVDVALGLLVEGALIERRRRGQSDGLVCLLRILRGWGFRCLNDLVVVWQGEVKLPIGGDLEPAGVTTHWSFWATGCASRAHEPCLARVWCFQPTYLLCIQTPLSATCKTRLLCCTIVGTYHNCAQAIDRKTITPSGPRRWDHSVCSCYERARPNRIGSIPTGLKRKRNAAC